MNRKQGIVILTGLVVILAMTAYPPWLYTFEGVEPPLERVWASYYWIFDPPMPYGVQIHLRLLATQCAAVAGVMLVLFAALRDRGK